MSSSKVKVFVTHSFDPHDEGDVHRILALLRLPRFHLEIVTARSPEAQKIGDKIERCIDWADVTFGIFTKRYTDVDAEVSVPPPYVISECAFAKGRYANDPHKGVHGLIEHPIKPTDLGILAVGGDEFPIFKRSQLAPGKTGAIEKFLDTLHQRYGISSRKSPRRPYKQKQVRKTVEVLRNGTAIFKHTVTVLVYEPKAIDHRGISHELWAPRDGIELPGLSLMARTPLVRHHDRASFSCFCIKKNNNPLCKPMEVIPGEQSARLISFRLRFPLEVTASDIVCYQYVWSLPGAYATCEEDMAESGYNRVSLRTPHGSIDDAVLKLKFEREVVHGASAELFSKKPFVLYSYTQKEDTFPTDDPVPMDLIEYDARWEIYQVQNVNLHNAVQAQWRPSSKASVRRDLKLAEVAQAQIVSERDEAPFDNDITSHDKIMVKARLPLKRPRPRRQSAS